MPAQHVLSILHSTIVGYTGRSTSYCDKIFSDADTDKTFVCYPRQDVNNDGFNDVILGESPEFSSTAGAAYVVFGSESFSFVDIDVSTLDGTNGFKIDGTDVGDYAGTSVASAGVSLTSTSVLQETHSPGWRYLAGSLHNEDGRWIIRKCL